VLARRLLLALCVGWPGCHPRLKPDFPPAGTATELWTELWVNQASLPGGDGSTARPFKSLSEALAKAEKRPTRIQLAAGLYAGPFRTAGPVQISGGPSSILFSEGLDAVLLPGAEIQLEGVGVQGGSIGIEASGRVSMRGVLFSGQRMAAVRLRGGALTAHASTFSASISETLGIVLEEDAEADLSACIFLGPYRRALQSKSRNTVGITDSRFEGPVTGIHQTAGTIRVQRTSFSGGRGPALFTARGRLELSDVRVHGHEYGVQCGEGATLKADGFSSIRADRAGIALARATAELEEIVIVDSGSFGGLQLVSAAASLRRFWIHGGEAYGIHARDSQLTASDGAITQIKDRDGAAGDGIHVRGGRTTLASVSIRIAAGAGALAAESAELSMRDVTLENCRWAGLIAETLARVRGSSLWVRHAGGAAIAVPSEADVQIDLLGSEGNSQGAVWAECASGAQVVLSRPRGDALGGTTSRCVRIAPSPKR
jgi:hypothetical protein